MNPIIINEKNFARFAKRLQKLLAEKTQNQYAPGLMESQEFLSQVFGVQSLHEMKKMLADLAQQEKLSHAHESEPVSTENHDFFQVAQSKMSVELKKSLKQMEKNQQELEQWMTIQKMSDGYNRSDTAVKNETIFFQELHQAYAQVAHGININRENLLNNLLRELDRNNRTEKWKETGYVLGCFFQAVVSNEVVDITLPFDWIPLPNGQENWEDDGFVDEYRPLTAHDLKGLINSYKEYMEEKNLSHAQIEVRPYYKTTENKTHPQVFQMVEMVSDNQKKLKIK